MQGRNSVGFAAFAFVVVLATAGQAAPFQMAPTGAAAALPIQRVVVFGQNARRVPQVYAEEHGLPAAEVIRNHAASGLIQCGNAHGAGQLTLSDDVVTTAAHVFYDENGLPRARSCTFEYTAGKAEQHVTIDVANVVAGSTKPYDVAVTHDWAVARLSHAVTGVRPYGIAGDAHANEPMTFVARGHIDWGNAKNLSLQDCTLHDQLSEGEEGTREFSFDCDTGDGASGGAVMLDHDASQVGGILVGWRSNKPFQAVPFSRMHYNFAVTLEGAFREAVIAAAGKMVSQK